MELRDACKGEERNLTPPLPWLFSLIFRTAMREAKVVGFIPSNAAAPPGPKILPPDCFRAAAMPSRSWRFISLRVISAGFETT